MSYLKKSFFLTLTLMMSTALNFTYAYETKEKHYTLSTPKDISNNEVISILNQKLKVDFTLRDGDFTHDLFTNIFFHTLEDYNDQKIIIGVTKKQSYTDMDLDFSYRKTPSSKIKHTKLTQRFSLVKSQQTIEFKLVNDFNSFTKGLINSFLRLTNKNRVIPDTVICKISPYGRDLRVSLFFKVYGSPSSSSFEKEINKYYRAIEISSREFVFPYIRNSY